MTVVLFIILPYLVPVEELPHRRLRSYVVFPYGVLSMATYLTYNSNASVWIFDCNVRDIEELPKAVEDFKPDVVALSMMFDNSYQYLRGILDAITIPCHCVIGGMAATGQYREILLNNPEIDAVCYHEGEIPMLELVRHPESALTECPAWITRTKIMEGVEPRKVVVQNLDDVINIDYSLVNPEDYPMRESFSPYANKIRDRKQFFIITSRGCPFGCRFCMHSADPDKSMRYAGVSTVIDHVRYLVEGFGCNVLTFYDDQFLLNKKRAKEILKGLAQFKIRLEFPNGVSVAFIDDELARLLAEAGTDSINLAIESGSSHVLNDLINKPLKIEQVKPAIDALHKYGIWCFGFFVTGMPGETDEDRVQTVKFIKDVGLDWAGFSDACPIRGSDLYRECIENGYIDKDAPIDMNRYMINTPEWTAEELVKMSYAMNLEVNFIDNHAMRIGDYELAMREFLAVLERDPTHAFALHGISVAAAKQYVKILRENRGWQDWLVQFS